jgi:hypothetical protein
VQTPQRRREAATCARSARAEGPVAPRGFARVPVVGPNRCATLRRPSGLSAGDTVFGAIWGRFGPILGLTGHFPWHAMARGVWYLAQAAAGAAADVRGGGKRTKTRTPASTPAVGASAHKCVPCASLRPWDRTWGAFMGSRGPQNRGNWVKKPVKTPEKRLRNA